MEGWVKLWRKSIKKGWLRNHKLWVFWTYCIMKASGIDTDEIKGYKEVKLKRGQFIFGLHRASKDLKMGIKSIRTCLVHLEKWGNIDKQSNNQFSIITVLNYNLYNTNEDKKGKQSGKQVANEGQTRGKQGATLKKDKKDKEGKESIQSIREEYIKIKGLNIKDFASDDYARSGKAINTLLLKAKGDQALVIKSIQWAGNQKWCDFTLETVVRRWVDFMKESDAPALFQKWRTKT